MLTERRIETITPGETIWAYGVKFLVKANHFDPKGNATLAQTNYPRHVLYCDAVDAQDVPEIYRKDMTIGRRIGETITVEVES